MKMMEKTNHPFLLGLRGSRSKDLREGRLVLRPRRVRILVCNLEEVLFLCKVFDHQALLLYS